MKRVLLNINSDTAKVFVDFLANYGYWGQTECQWDIDHGAEKVVFIINGHELSNVSNQRGQIVIDGAYRDARPGCVYLVESNECPSLDYCMKVLGF